MSYTRSQKVCAVSAASGSMVAEGVGFEPTRPETRSGGFQDRCDQPLCHPSAGGAVWLV